MAGFRGCPDIRHFDAIGATGDGQVKATLDPQGTPGGPYAALVTVDDPALITRTATMPFDLAAVTGMAGIPGKDGASLSAQANLLNYLLFWLGPTGPLPWMMSPESERYRSAPTPIPSIHRPRSPLIYPGPWKCRWTSSICRGGWSGAF